MATEKKNKPRPKHHRDSLTYALYGPDPQGIGDRDPIDHQDYETAAERAQAPAAAERQE